MDIKSGDRSLVLLEATMLVVTKSKRRCWSRGEAKLELNLLWLLSPLNGNLTIDDWNNRVFDVVIAFVCVLALHAFQEFLRSVLQGQPHDDIDNRHFLSLHSCIVLFLWAHRAFAAQVCSSFASSLPKPF